MGITLGPGGRALLVLLGLAVVYLAFDRAGWLPEGLPRIVGPRHEAPMKPGQGLSEASFAWDRGLSCERPLRVAATHRVAAARVGPVEGKVVMEGAPTARIALERLASGAVSSALVSMSELAAEWELAARAHPEVAIEVAGTPPDIVLYAQHGTALQDLAGKRVAAVPGSAAEYRLLGALAQAGLLDRVERVAATSDDDALALVKRGEADAAVAPAQHVGQALRMGQAEALPLVATLDPLLLVLAGTATGCAAEIQLLDGDLLARAHEVFPDPGLALQAALASPVPPPRPGELLRSWQAATRVRGGPAAPPLALVAPLEAR